MTLFITKAQTINLLELLKRPKPEPTRLLKYGDGLFEFGQLWLPESSGIHPVVVMIHGGCWQTLLPGIGLMEFLAEDMRKSGYAVWSIEYVRLGYMGGGYPETFLDIGHGIDYLRTISSTYKLDLSHVTAIGHSAGGQLALWAAARNHLKPTSKVYLANPLPITFVVTLAGINDLKKYRDRGSLACGGPDTIDQLIDTRRRLREDPYADTSPASMLPIGVKQLVVSGRLDAIVLSFFGDDYSALAEQRGDQVESMDIKDTGHFELIDPTSNAWGQIKKKIIEETHH